MRKCICMSVRRLCSYLTAYLEAWPIVETVRILLHFEAWPIVVRYLTFMKDHTFIRRWCYVGFFSVLFVGGFLFGNID